MSYVFIQSKKGVRSHKCLEKKLTRPRGYKTFSMLKYTEDEIYQAHKCCWHLNIYKHDKIKYLRV